MNGTRSIRIAILALYSISVFSSCNIASINPSIHEHALSIEQFIYDEELEQLILYDITAEQQPFIGSRFSLYPYKHITRKQSRLGQGQPKKDWTIIIYAAADNDLRPFALRNIKQMANVGSNERITIFVHLDIVANGKQKITRRYIVNKNELISVDEEHTNTGYMDSGDPETLISCCKWAIENCPAKHYALVFWNHGSGAIDPQHVKTIHPATLFTFEPHKEKLEIDRSSGYLDIITDKSVYKSVLNKRTADISKALYTRYKESDQQDPVNVYLLSMLYLIRDTLGETRWNETARSYQVYQEQLSEQHPIDIYVLSMLYLLTMKRGICWDDTTGNYLTNQKVDYALNTICNECLDGKKFDVIAFDACLMSMIEVANIMRKYAHIMTASQEVELGYGWNYEKVLAPFRSTTLSREEFATHIVKMFESTYNRLTNDFTQSAIDLAGIELLESNINSVARLLHEGLKLQKNRSVKNTIKSCKSRLSCTHFDEPSYIDLHHLYGNILNNLKRFTFVDEQRGEQIKEGLRQALEYGRTLIEHTVIANAVGKNLSKARGIAIYFPDRRIHSSYRRTTFAETNAWLSFLDVYLRT